MRVFAIGDIHGSLGAMEALDQALTFGKSDTVITLGDHIDRGKNSRGVIAYLLELKKRCRLIPLRGNHEIMMLRAHADRHLLPFWLSHGGDATLDSYQASSFDDIPPNHWRFIESTVPLHRERNAFFVHANACPETDFENQPDRLLYWTPLTKITPHKSGLKMICGHTEQPGGLPLATPHAICLDTGAHSGGWLTCLNVDTLEYHQASETGLIRTGFLTISDQ